MVNKRDVRMLSFEEREQIEELLKTGISCSEVARRIGRSKNGVVNEVRMNGGIKSYKAVSAHESAYERQVIGRQKLRSLNTNQKRSALTNSLRIDHLEMQVEILVEALQEARDGK